MYFSETKSSAQCDVDWKSSQYMVEGIQGGDVAAMSDYFLKDDAYNRLCDPNMLFAESHSFYQSASGEYNTKQDQYIPFYATDTMYAQAAGKSSGNPQETAESNFTTAFAEGMYAANIGINPAALNYNYQFFDGDQAFAPNGTRKSFTYGAHHESGSEANYLVHANYDNTMLGADSISGPEMQYPYAAIDSKSFYMQEGKRRKSIAVPDEYRTRSTMRHLDSEKRRRAAINELYAQLESKVRHMIDGKVSKARILHVTANTIEYYKKAIGDL